MCIGCYATCLVSRWLTFCPIIAYGRESDTRKINDAQFVVAFAFAFERRLYPTVGKTTAGRGSISIDLQDGSEELFAETPVPYRFAGYDEQSPFESAFGDKHPV